MRWEWRADEVIAEVTSARPFYLQPPAAGMFARHVASRPAVLARQRAARTVPLVATWSSTIGRRNMSQLSRSSSRISTVFGGLLVVGIVTTGYGLYVHLPFAPGGKYTHSVEKPCNYTS